LSIIPKYAIREITFIKLYVFINVGLKIAANVMWLAFSGVEPTPSHYKYNKTFHSAADFP
jgi:hypothetical protein